MAVDLQQLGSQVTATAERDTLYRLSTAFHKLLRLTQDGVEAYEERTVMTKRRTRGTRKRKRKARRRKTMKMKLRRKIKKKIRRKIRMRKTRTRWED